MSGGNPPRTDELFPPDPDAGYVRSHASIHDDLLRVNIENYEPRREVARLQVTEDERQAEITRARFMAELPDIPKLPMTDSPSEVSSEPKCPTCGSERAAPPCRNCGYDFIQHHPTQGWCYNGMTGEDATQYEPVISAPSEVSSLEIEWLIAQLVGQIPTPSNPVVWLAGEDQVAAIAEAIRSYVASLEAVSPAPTKNPATNSKIKSLVDLVTRISELEALILTPEEARAQIEGMHHLPDPRYQVWLRGRNKLRDTAGMGLQPHEVPPHFPGRSHV